MRDITGSIISVTQRLFLQVAAHRMKRGLGPLPIEKVFDIRPRIHRCLIFCSSEVKAAGIQIILITSSGENSNLSFLFGLESGPFSGPLFICRYFSFIRRSSASSGDTRLRFGFYPAKIRWSAIFIASFSKPRFSAFRNNS